MKPEDIEKILRQNKDMMAAAMELNQMQMVHFTKVLNKLDDKAMKGEQLTTFELDKLTDMETYFDGMPAVGATAYMLNRIKRLRGF